MIRKPVNSAATEAARISQMGELDGYKIGDEIWALLREGAVGHGKITELHASQTENSVTFYDEEGGKYRCVRTLDLSREELKKVRKSRTRP